MNKLKSCIIAAGTLAALLLTTCQVTFVDSISLPPELPYCKIMASNNTSTGNEDYSFVMEWRRKPGLLPYTTVDPKAEVKEIIATLSQAHDVWAEYVDFIDPKPFWDPDGNGKAQIDGVPMMSSEPYNVFVNVNSVFKLDNDPAQGPLIIRRYWPTVTDGAGMPMTPDVAVWYASEEARKKAFKKAAAEVEDMLAAIKGSYFYARETFTVTGNTGEEMEVPNPLRTYYDDMARVISHNPPLEDCKQLRTFDTEGGVSHAVTLRPGVSGILYEYYLGYVPYREDYKNPNDHFSFPGTPPKP
ncbi:hypothetical protein FACS189473_0270 [Spirochaetia bacterium]|nr:hypothetical protein FACS189473_0270 [Spirochaetia bacterium]